MYTTKNKIIVFFISSMLCFFAQISSAQTKQAYVQNKSYTQTQSYTQANRQTILNTAQSVNITGMTNGRVIETNNSIVIDGGNLSNTKEGAPHISIKNTNKRVILNNVNVLSSNATQSLIDVDSKANIIIRGIHTIANNSDIKVDKTKNENNCGALFCIKSDRANIQSIKVDEHGYNSYGVK